MSNPRAVRLPDAIDACIERRMEQLGFDNFSQYSTSLVSYDLCIAKPHSVTGDFHEQGGAERDRIYTEIGRAFMAGETLGGAWLRANLREVVKELALEQPPPMSQVAQKLRQKLAAKPKKPKG